VVVDISSLFQLSCVFAYLLNEILRTGPIANSIHVNNMFVLYFFKDASDVVFRVRDALRPYHALEHFILLRLAHIVNNSGTVD